MKPIIFVDTEVMADNKATISEQLRSGEKLIRVLSTSFIRSFQRNVSLRTQYY